MGKKHDEIIFSLTEEKITELLAERIYGKKGSWSKYHDIHRKELKDIPINLFAKAIFNNLGIYEVNKLENKEYIPEKIPSIKELQEIYINNNNEIEDTPLNKSLIIKRRIEVPLTKGNGQYQTTKGYLDIFCLVSPKKIAEFSCYQEDEKAAIIIEVKQKNDFKDVGAIIRQLNDYKSYFGEWEYGEFNEHIRKKIWVVYSDEEIPKLARDMLEKEGYICLDEGGEK